MVLPRKFWLMKLILPHPRSWSASFVINQAILSRQLLHLLRRHVLRMAWQNRQTVVTDRSAPALSTSQPLAFARSSTSASSPPSSAPLFPTTLAVLSLIAPPLRSLQTPRLRSIDSGARFGPKSTHKRASRLPTRRWSTLPTPGKLDHGVTQGQGRAGSAQGVPRQTPGFTSHNVVHSARRTIFVSVSSS